MSAGPACRQRDRPGSQLQSAKSAKREEMFAKMAANMESMPEDFPPVALFNNIAAIRETTERILEVLEKD